MRILGKQMRHVAITHLCITLEATRMKKLLFLLLILVLVLTACGGDKDEGKSDDGAEPYPSL